MRKIIETLKNEMDQADTYMIEGDCTMYGTSAEYQAYIDGIDFAVNTIKDTSYVTTPSTWEITYCDGRKIKVKAGDIISCINELIRQGEPVEEVVTFNCLPEEEPKKKYYAISTSMTFEKTVLVPVDSVKDADEAMDLVDAGVEICTINLLDEDADFETKDNGIYEMSDKDAALYQILTGDSSEESADSMYLVYVIYQYDGYDNTEVYRDRDSAIEAANLLLSEFKQQGYVITPDYTDDDTFSDMIDDLICIRLSNKDGDVEITVEKKTVN